MSRIQQVVPVLSWHETRFEGYVLGRYSCWCGWTVPVTGEPFSGAALAARAHITEANEEMVKGAIDV